MNTKLTAHYTATKKILIMAAFLPIMGFASLAHAEINTPTVSNFCAKIDSSAATLDQLISDQEKKYESGKTARIDALAESRKESDKALYDARVAANETYKSQFKTLLAQANTPEQKTAVATFKKTVLQAVATRRANVDIAIKNYRDGVDALLLKNSTSYTQALATLKNTIGASLETAKVNCATNTDPVRIKASTDSAFKTAQTVFDTTTTNFDEAAQKLSQLAETRDSAIGAIDAKFNTLIQTATTKLQTVLGDN